MLKKYALKMGVKPYPFCGGYPTIEGFSDNPGMYAISCGGIESNKQRIRYSSDGMETVNVYEGSVENGSESVAV